MHSPDRPCKSARRARREKRRRSCSRNCCRPPRQSIGRLLLWACHRGWQARHMYQAPAGGSRSPSGRESCTPAPRESTFRWASSHCSTDSSWSDTWTLGRRGGHRLLAPVSAQRPLARPLRCPDRFRAGERHLRHIGDCSRSSVRSPNRNCRPARVPARLAEHCLGQRIEHVSSKIPRNGNHASAPRRRGHGGHRRTAG